MTPQQQTPQTYRPRLLFVDDEQRVLNSMRIMFKRQFDLFLASGGSEALEIIRKKDIDVIVADHRMPQMTGVEVLSKVRSLSPRTVRILLTGYADLDAVEGSINDCEVFRFLTKPCAPDELRETVALAARLARQTPSGDDLGDDAVDAILAQDTPPTPRPAAPAAAPGAAPARRQQGSPPAPAQRPDAGTAEAEADADFDPVITSVIERPPVIDAPPKRDTAPDQPAARQQSGLGIIVFSADDEVISTVQKSVRGRLPVYAASNIVQVVKLLTEHRPGVLVTDVSEDKATIQAMTARLKEHLPELVTIAVSEHRDVLDMVWLINHGQIFRFLRKPLSTGRCAISLQAALKHHRNLLRNPELVKRHTVDSSEGTGIVDGMLNKIKSVRRFWASA